MSDVGRVDETTWFFRNVVRKRVAWGFPAAAVVILLACPTRASVLLGFWIALVGAAVRTWSSGTIVKRYVLATEGPYRLTRNPLYVGSFLMALGVVIMANQWLLGGAFLGLFAVVYHHLVRREEKALLERHGEAFAAYVKEVPRFIPNRKAWPPAPAEYDVRRMWSEHREWRAWLGLYAVTLWLLLRAG